MKQINREGTLKKFFIISFVLCMSILFISCKEENEYSFDYSKYPINTTYKIMSTSFDSYFFFDRNKTEKLSLEGDLENNLRAVITDDKIKVSGTFTLDGLEFIVEGKGAIKIMTADNQPDLIMSNLTGILKIDNDERPVTIAFRRLSDSESFTIMAEDDGPKIDIGKIDVSNLDMSKYKLKK